MMEKWKYIKDYKNIVEKIKQTKQKNNEMKK